MDGGSPAQIFDAYRNPDAKTSPDPATLSLLMAEHERRMVRECAITLNKRRYVPVDQAGWFTLHERNERNVVIAYEPGDMEYAIALDEDGNFLAQLQVEQLVRFAPGAPDTQRQIAESMATRRRLEKRLGDTVSEITRVARANGAHSPLESLASRLELPADTTGIISQRKPRLDVEPEPSNGLVPGQAADRLAARLRRNQ
jgi:hypothetical protein